MLRHVNVKKKNHMHLPLRKLNYELLLKFAPVI